MVDHARTTVDIVLIDAIKKLVQSEQVVADNILKDTIKYLQIARTPHDAS